MTKKKGRIKVKKQFVRAAALLMAIAMLLCTFAGCGDDGGNSSSSQASGSSAESVSGSEGEASSSEEENSLVGKYPEFANHDELEITWFEQGWTGPEEGKDIIAPKIEEVTNLKLGYTPMTTPTDDEYTQQLNLMIAGGEIPEAFFGGITAYTREIYQKLGESGQIWDLTEMVTEEAYPNLYALIHPEMELYATDKGQSWFLPTQTGRGYENLNEPPHGLHVSTKYMEQLKVDYPTTADEFYDFVYRSVNELGGKGLLFGENLGGVNQLYEMFFPHIGSHDSYELPFDVDNGYKVCNYLYSDSDEMMAAAKYIWKFASNGLLDPEALTLKTTQFQEKAALGEYAALTAAWWEIDNFNDAIGSYNYIAPPPMYASEEVKKAREITWTDWVGCWSSLIINKDVDEQVVKHLLATMDWLATEEGQLLVNAGIEGETYEFLEDGTYAYTDQFKADSNDLDWNTAASFGVFYYAQLVQNAPAISEFQETPSALIREDNKKSWDSRAEERARYDREWEPTYDYYFLKGDKENELMPAINDARTEFLAKVVSAKSEDEVEQLVHEWSQTCKNLGIEQVVAERQAAIDSIIERMSE